MKTNPKNLIANWQAFERRPTWSCVGSRELAEVLGVHLQTISNWKIRGLLPAPVPNPRPVGNRNHYRIGAVRAWLESRPEDEIHWEWIRRHMGEGFVSIPQAQLVAQICYKEFNIEQAYPQMS
jgi:hypothetical protein